MVGQNIKPFANNTYNPLRVDFLGGNPYFYAMAWSWAEKSRWIFPQRDHSRDVGINMEKLAFDLVSDQKKSKFDVAISEKFYWTGLAGLGFLLATFWIFQNYLDINLEDLQGVKYIMYGLLICVAIGTFYGLVDYNGNNRKISGIITFDENEITLNHIDKFELSAIPKIKFSLNDYKGRPINLISDGDPNRSYGGDNFVEFRHRNKTHKYQFVIDSKRHRNLLVEKTIPKMRNKTQIKY